MYLRWAMRSSKRRREVKGNGDEDSLIGLKLHHSKRASRVAHVPGGMRYRCISSPERHFPVNGHVRIIECIALQMMRKSSLLVLYK